MLTANQGATNMTGTQWMIDGQVNLTQIATESDWHLASTIDGLMAAGLGRADAEAFADFAFADRAGERNAQDCLGADFDACEDRWDRLSI